jgi:hypothetical protein
VSDNPLIDAIEVLKYTPELLTPAMVALITKADPDLGQQALHEHRAARKRGNMEALARVIVNTIKPLQTEVADLRTRVLDLEATRAARTGETVDER